MSQLLAGVGRRTINPPIGMRREGARLFADPIQAVDGNLTATVLVFAVAGQRVGIIALDLVLATVETATALRSSAAAAMDAPLQNVLLNFSHSHSSPSLGMAPDIDLEQREMVSAYREQLAERIGEATREAIADLRPARVAAGWGSSDIGVYRREIGPDGRDHLGEVPDAPIDPSVGVIRVDDRQGRPIAICFSYGCHPVTCGPRSHLASPDFPGPAREVIERSLGTTALFLQACGGNINPRAGVGYEVDCRETRDRVGIALGAEALRVAAGLRTNKVRGDRVALGPVAGISARPWVPIADVPQRLAAAERTVAIPLAALPSRSEAEGLCDRYHAELVTAVRAGNPALTYVAHRWATWADRLVDAVTRGQTSVDLPVQVIRLGDIALVGLGAETFFETGLAIKEASPMEHTQVLGYSNGVIGYLPRAEDHPTEGWRLDTQYAVPDLFPQFYLLPTITQPEAEALAVDAALQLLRDLD